jgi:hypothetical protein
LRSVDGSPAVKLGTGFAWSALTGRLARGRDSRCRRPFVFAVYARG